MNRPKLVLGHKVVLQKENYKRIATSTMLKLKYTAHFLNHERTLWEVFYKKGFWKSHGKTPSTGISQSGIFHSWCLILLATTVVELIFFFFQISWKTRKSHSLIKSWVMRPLEFRRNYCML